MTFLDGYFYSLVFIMGFTFYSVMSREENGQTSTKEKPRSAVNLKNLFIFIKKPLVTLGICISIVEFLILGVFSQHLEDYGIIVNAVVGLSTGFIGIVIAFEIERFANQLRKQIELKRLYEALISELTEASKKIRKNYVMEIMNQQSFSMQLWDVYKEKITILSVEHAIALADIYNGINHLHTSRDVVISSRKKLVDMSFTAQSTADKIDKWILKVVKAYSKIGIELKIVEKK